MLPTKQQAIKLIKLNNKIIDDINKKQGLETGHSYKHYKAVAFCAEKIASHCQNLNSEKAWILGLLHDYGEAIEKTIPKTFHGTAGYDEMMKLGYDEVARTCLTHSFFDNNFNPKESSYDSQSIIRAQKIISDMALDDYDYLIQISDLLVTGSKITDIETRLEYIAEKYHVAEKIMKHKYESAKQLKEYFDKKTGQNIYDLVGVTHE